MTFKKVLFGLMLVGLYGTASAQSDEVDTTQDSPASSSAQDAGDEGRRVRRLGDVIGEETAEFSMDIPDMDIPQAPLQPQPDVSLPDPQTDAQLQNLLARRAFVPDNPEIEAELAALLDEVERDAAAALATGDMALAQRLVNVLAALDEGRDVIAQVAAEQQRLSSIDQLLGLASEAIELENLTEPGNESAWVYFQQVLELDPENASALAGIAAITDQQMDQIYLLVEEGDFESALEGIGEAEALGMDAERLAQVQTDIQSAQADEMDRLLSETLDFIDDGAYEDAESNINVLIGMGADARQIERLRSALDDAMRYAGFEPGQSFQDGLGNSDAFGPVMVVIPSGSFVMGSPDDEQDRFENEGPQFRVRFERGFALSRTEITVAQFRQFVQDTRYTTDAERAGRSRIYREASGRIDQTSDVDWRNNYLGQEAEDNTPVIHVSFNDAQAYADWLSEQTGRPYRLPSEAEFEYALRAGTTTRYWWGDESPEDNTENVTGDGDEFIDQRSWTNSFRRYTDGFWGPAPVGSLTANAFGLHDMGGNVMEWNEDCWHDSYVRAPTDGSAWVNPGCNRRMLRGASWSSTPVMSRSAYRLSATAESTDARVGFRVARDL